MYVFIYGVANVVTSILYLEVIVSFSICSLIIFIILLVNESVEKKTPDSPMPASPAPDESPSTVSVPPPDESPAAAQKKALPHLPSLPPTPVEVSYIDGRTETWFKSYTQRSEGKTAGKIEILFCS